ncbi:Alpha/Beta hydrolase protein [Myxozyma melibiosi]|uniref:Alpha/Beta hydrolase protein n=1 Tax=Myxozyma melibiosi TaxID=54550 RepID=A0ABR1FDM9_9ASCO
MTSAADVFHIERRVFPAAMPRSTTRAVVNPDTDRLEVAAKIYRPKSNPDPRAGDVTIVAAHANGFAKELYEVLFMELLALSEKNGFRIRYIVIADVVSEGESGILNESKLGDHFSWLDCSLDVELMIQILAPPPPLVAMGHSFGGAILFNLATIHPSLFTALIGLDPIMEARVDAEQVAVMPATLSARRHDLWPSKEDARDYFAKRKMYHRFDPRVFELWMEYGVRHLPTKLYPSYPGSPSTKTSDAVTLTTTRYQEVYVFVQPSDPNSSAGPLHRPDSFMVFDKLHKLTSAPILFISGSLSDVSERFHKKLEILKQAEYKVMKDGAHLFPLEYPTETAEWVAPFLGKTLSKYEEQRKADRASGRFPDRFNDYYKKHLKIEAKKPAKL